MWLHLNHPIVALSLVTFAMGLMPLNDAAIKLMSADLSLSQIIVVRAALILACLLVLRSTWRSFRGYDAAVWGLMLLRGSLIALAMIAFFSGLAFMDLWQATTIFFTSPLLITLLSVPLLGERLGVWRILAQFLGLGGVLLITVPVSEGGFNPVFALPLAGGLFYAFYNILTRRMAGRASTVAMANVQHLAYILVGGLLAVGVRVLPFEQFSPTDLGPEASFVVRDWVMPSLLHWSWLAGTGLLFGFLSFASANAYANVEASLVAPFEYIYIPVSIFWSIAIWNDWPNLLGWLGCGLILSGGLLTIVRENLRNAGARTREPMHRP